jgi:hypothetical protein
MSSMGKEINFSVYMRRKVSKEKRPREQENKLINLPSSEEHTYWQNGKNV